MRIIDNTITGNQLVKLGKQYHKQLNPLTKKNEFNKKYPAGKIEKYANDSDEDYQAIYEFLGQNIKELFYGDVSELLRINNEIKSLLTIHGLERPNFEDTSFSKVFNYEWFRDHNKMCNEWFGLLKIKVCPYCNRSFLSATKSHNQNVDEKVLYFDIDHFFPKERYPWLALSFFNLIPSCTLCNQRIKGKKELKYGVHIHPYVDDMDKLLKFHIPVDSLDIFLSDVPIKLEIVPRPPYTDQSSDYIRAKNTYLFFNLNNLYNTHLDYVREILQKDIVYSPSYIKQLYTDYGSDGADIFSSKSDMMKMLMGNYVLSEHIHERPLAKLTKDLMEDFSLNLN